MARRHERVVDHPLQNGIALQQPPQAIYDGLVVSKQADTRGGADSRGAVDALRLVALAAADQPDPVDLLRQRPMHDRHELSAEIRAVLRDLRSALAAHGNRDRKSVV